MAQTCGSNGMNVALPTMGLVFGFLWGNNKYHYYAAQEAKLQEQKRAKKAEEQRKLEDELRFLRTEVEKYKSGKAATTSAPVAGQLLHNVVYEFLNLQTDTQKKSLEPLIDVVAPMFEGKDKKH